MPHACTTCSRTFEDGSKQMLAGCPDCGGKKFQFLPESAVQAPGDDRPASSDSSGADHADPSSRSDLTSRSDTLASEDFDDPQGSPGHESDSDIIEAPAEAIDPPDDGEDRAQAMARRSIVTPDELPPVDLPGSDGEPERSPDASDRPDLAELRQELNEQFESIKILKPGEYELNLMELYDRQEYIIALEEDGRYVIDVPDTWGEQD